MSLSVYTIRISDEDRSRLEIIAKATNRSGGNVLRYLISLAWQEPRLMRNIIDTQIRDDLEVNNFRERIEEKL